MVRLESPLHHTVNVKTLEHRPPARRTELSSGSRARENQLQGTRHTAGIAGLYKKAVDAVTDDLGDSTNPAGDGRTAEKEGVQ